MNYSQAHEYISSHLRFGIKPGLERISALLEHLGNVHKKTRFVHVAGTNGKGSTCTMIAEILSASGLKTGLYTSPYVLNFRERFRIDGQMISEDAFAKIVTDMIPACEKVERECGELTEFELITAAAFVWYAEEKCDVVVLETGMGGRFDATNVIEEPLCSVITRIDLDHMAVLGDSFAKIAYEKAGIIKSGCPCIIAPCQNEQALAALLEVAQSKDSPATVCDLEHSHIISSDISGTKAEIDGISLTISLAGAHQLENATSAVRCARALAAQGLPVTDSAIVKGVENASLPARMEILSRSPLMILDGAHNPNGAQSLANAIDTLLSGRTVIGIMGILSDKNYCEAVKILAPRFSQMITLAPPNPRALSAQELALLASLYCPAKPCQSPDEAIEYALAQCPADGAVVMCGSLYLAGQLHDLVLDAVGEKK